MVSEEAYNEIFTLINGICHNLESLVSANGLKKIVTEQNNENVTFLPLYAPSNRHLLEKNKENMLNNLLRLKEGLNKMDTVLMEHLHQQNSNTKND